LHILGLGLGSVALTLHVSGLGLGFLALALTPLALLTSLAAVHSDGSCSHAHKLSLYGIIYVTWYTSHLPEPTAVYWSQKPVDVSTDHVTVVYITNNTRHALLIG